MGGQLAGVATEHGGVVRGAATDKGDAVEAFGQHGRTRSRVLWARGGDPRQHFWLLAHLGTHQLISHRLFPFRIALVVTLQGLKGADRGLQTADSTLPARLSSGSNKTRLWHHGSGPSRR